MELKSALARNKQLTSDLEHLVNESAESSISVRNAEKLRISELDRVYSALETSYAKLQSQCAILHEQNAAYQIQMDEFVREK